MPEGGLSPESIEALGRLKELPRSGWIDRGIPAELAESVADHSFGVALLSWLLAPDTLDRSRVVELALLHDLAEATVGDAPPYDRDVLQSLDLETRKNSRNQRHVRTEDERAAKLTVEAGAIASLADTLPGDRRDRMLALWNELSERTTAEARFVKEIDILETWLQSRRYAELYPEAPMESFEAEARAELGERFDLDALG